MNVFVTGATGFVGGATLPALRARWHEVIALVRSHATLAGVSTIRGDLRDPNAIEHALEGMDAVVHAGAVVDPRLAQDEGEVARINRDASIALGRAAKERGVRTFVFVSSIAAMGIRSERMTPFSACHPQSAYGRAKLAAEEGLLALASHDFRVVVVRPPTVYGPGERYNFLALVRAIDRGYFRVLGRGDNIFPIASSVNVAHVLVAAAEGRLANGVHLVADPTTTSMNRIHRAIARGLGRKPTALHVPLTLAHAAAACNELAGRLGAPIFLTRARVRTLTANQPFDVSSLIAAGIELDDRVEQHIAEAIADHRARHVL